MSLSRRGLLGLALALPAGAARAAQTTPPLPLIMATGRAGTTYARFGTAWGGLAEKAGLNIVFRASNGAVANVLLIQRNAAQLGMTTTMVGAEARQGRGRWTAGVKFNAFRVLFPAFPSALQIVSPRRTGITSVAQLAGKRIGLGAPGDTDSTAVPAILAALGLSGDFVTTGTFQSGLQQMAAGLLDACAFISAPPLEPIAAAAAHQELALIGLTPAQIDQLEQTIPGLYGMVLPAGLFPGQYQPVACIGTPNLAIGAAALPDHVARDITFAGLRHRDMLAATVPAARAQPDLQPVIA
ncbi:MAG TPA: TAXI family TRAP transporter solute-binding subunit, partial [Acidocella sp.]|nr:TAXI family TRAP transporter solute-binding subunit [Acidocella sp.]